MIARRTFASFLVGALLAWAPAQLAHAQGAEARTQSRERFERGIAHLAEQSYPEAVRELEAARSLYPTASIHFNLGLAYRGIGRSRDAIASFERFLAAVGETGDPERVEEVNRYLRTLRSALARVRVRVSPADAQVSVDGTPIAVGESEIALDPGSHVLEASAPGHRAVRREIRVEPGSSTTEVLALEQTAGRAATLALDVSPDHAAVQLDGRPRGTGDQEIELDAGAHTLAVSADGRDLSREFSIAAGQRLALTMEIPQGGDDLTWLWVVLGVVVVGGAAGVAAAVLYEPDVQAPLDGNLGVVMTTLGAM
jgi:tetratricopeptide (TPR) repeat protein